MIDKSINYIFGKNEFYSIFDFNKIKQIDKCLAITPYYGLGGIKDDISDEIYPHLKTTNRNAHVIYLIKTIFGLKRYTNNIIIGTCNEKDFNDVLDICHIFNLQNIMIINQQIPSIFNPVNLLKEIKEKKIYKDYDYIMYTEADQILYFNPENMIPYIDDNHCLSFHRIVRKYIDDNEKTEKQICSNLKISIDDQLYYLACMQDFDNYFISEKFTISTTEAGSYGAAWFAKADIIERPDWDFKMSCPCEWASFHIYHNIKYMLKTKDPFEAFAVHLSGLDEHLRLNGELINDYPILW